MNARGKTVDTTFLSIDNAEERGFIHRDYIAHCLRWTHVVKRMYERNFYKGARVLDVGCGREIPFAKTLYSSKLIPEIYMGVDAGPINDEDVKIIADSNRFVHKVWEKCNMLELTQEDVATKIVDGKPVLPNIVTCFEVLEHVEPTMMMQMLDHIQKITSPDCRYFFSTPNWNIHDCAANHVNEMKYEALGAAFERHGFEVLHTYGTFASIRDYEGQIVDGNLVDHRNPSLPCQQLFDALREYYDTNFLSCIFAPLFPAQSRNALWELRKVEGDLNERLAKGVLKFARIEEIQKPWSSSINWKDMAS